MNCIPSLCVGAMLSLPLLAETTQPTPPWLFDFSPGPQHKLYWQTEPGQRYDLWESTTLLGWNQVTGFPKVAAGLAMEHAFSPDPGGKGFFKILPIDEQAPVVKSQYPAVDGFAVGRFADLAIELEDVSGIDPASIQLTIGGTGPLGPGAPGLTISGDTVTYDSGDSASGAWGETITATLVAADTLGNTLTHTWSFRLELEPLVAANVFVFGSPVAQRAGQRVAGPAAALAARFPVPAGPVKANDPPEWSISSVAADRVVIAYGEGGPPAFTVGQLISNLTPTNESEIFYRRVLSVANDPGAPALTLMTEEVELSAFATQGAASFSENSVIYELDESGALVRALSVDGTLTFPRIGYDLSGSSFRLREDGFQATVNGVTYSQGSSPTFLEITASQYSWWFTPRIRAGLEISGGTLQSFEAIASGDLSTSFGFVGQATLIGATDEEPRILYELPDNLKPEKIVFLGSIGIVPVFATLGFDFAIKGEAQAQAVVDFHGLYQHDFSATFGLSYRQESGIDWVRGFQDTAPVLEGEGSLGGEFSWTLSLEPELQFLLYGAAGIKADITPSAGIVASVPVSGDPKICFEADVDFAVAPAVHPDFDDDPAFAALDVELSYSIWSWRSCDEFAFTTHPQSQSVKKDEDVSLSCVVDVPDGAENPDFQWFHNGVAIPGQTGRSLFLYRVKEGHGGTYRVTATLGDVTLESDEAVLTVQGPAPEGFSLIPAGNFQMGDATGVGHSTELPVHTVYLSAFYIGKYEVTEAMWDEVRTWGLNNDYMDLPVGGDGGATNHPVHSINWYAMVKWCNARSQMDGLTPCYTVSGATYKTGNSEPECNWDANGYRLPSEAEWEKAARGGLSAQNFPWGNTISHSQANYYVLRFWNSATNHFSYDVSPTTDYHHWSYPRSSPVGSFAPNGYGLFEMGGNMRESCWDWHAPYSAGSQTDPRGGTSGSVRVNRGGSWFNGDSAFDCRVAVRPADGPDVSNDYLGFRIARSSVP